jgi:hypothetical protein
MADSISKLARDLRGFNANAEIVKALRKEINKPVPEVRRKIRASAMAILPAGGGLNAWVAAGRVSSIVKVSFRTVTVELRGGRNSINKKKSDFDAIDRGRVRHPSWGRRWEGQWHNQLVEPKFFSGPAGEESQWAKAIDAAVDSALARL